MYNVSVLMYVFMIDRDSRVCLHTSLTAHVVSMVMFSAYGLGLLVTFCALIFMEIGQPALLYLVPFTLITVFSISIYRREFRLIWKGEAVSAYNLQRP